MAEGSNSPPRVDETGLLVGEENRRHLVVVGASAGGIEALSALLSNLPRDFRAPLVIAQHLDPRRPSHLAEILARYSPLPVRTVQERDELTSGVVFLVPANRLVRSEITGFSSTPANMGSPNRPSICSCVPLPSAIARASSP